MALNNKVAVIVGATGQLGPAVAKAFARAGVKLVLVGTQREALDTVRRELTFRDTPAMIHALEAADETEMEELAEAVKLKFGRADILLHLMGSYKGGSLEDTPADVWDSMLGMNLYSAVNAIRAFLPLLQENGWGRVVTVSSGITQAPPPNVVAYVTSKAALETMTIAVAKELQETGVTANVVLIRSLDTPTERAKQPDKKTGWVKPDDVAATLLFLCSDEAGAITGTRIPVYGGN